MYHGVTFNNIRKALYYLYFGPDADEEESYKYILPMQQNFFNPIEIGSEDTYIQFFIMKDERLTQDFFLSNRDMTQKVATVTVRFVGAQAETWAKYFHHLTKMPVVSEIFSGTCQATKLEADGGITPIPVTFNGKNVHIAFDIMFKLHYVESVDIDWAPLNSVSIPSGTIR